MVQGSTMSKTSASEEACHMPTHIYRKASHVAQALDDSSAERRITSGRRSLRVLIIDDEQEAAEVLAGAIRSWGHEVIWAADGAGARAMATAHQPDAVLINIATPGMDGYELSQRFRRDPRLKGCLVLAMRTAQQRQSCQRNAADIDLFLAKPVDVLVLETLLLLEGERVDRLQAHKQSVQPGSTC
jgi:CheY-like chemotaxis protein